ncbi:MAG: ribonuclease P protein component [Proteobacteria bacterium]|nr:ribonuclease P protein component [Pseudomonadota bacterium]MDE3208073.1 ribonuclease P protein component [Pseudomonadota bacterium]
MGELYRFSRHNRLKSAMIRSVLSQSRRVNGMIFQVAGSVNNDNLPCLAVIVTRKVAKRAVDRNYARRVVREVFRKQQHALDSVSFVVRVKKRLVKGSYTSAAYELEQLFDKLVTCLAS